MEPNRPTEECHSVASSPEMEMRYTPTTADFETMKFIFDTDNTLNQLFHLSKNIEGVSLRPRLCLDLVTGSGDTIKLDVLQSELIKRRAATSASFQLQQPQAVSPTSNDSISGIPKNSLSSFCEKREQETRRKNCCSFCYGLNKKIAEGNKIEMPTRDDDGPWSTHSVVKDGKVSCPLLWFTQCASCGATGDKAHTPKYCPFPKRSLQGENMKRRGPSITME